MRVNEIVTARILEHMAQGAIPWRQHWRNKSLAANFVSRRQYTGINFWLLNLTPWASSFYGTMKQINEHGGRVKQGEKSSIAIFWKLWEVSSREKEGELDAVPVMRFYHLFNLAQCEGIKVPDIVPETRQPLAECEKVFADFAGKPRVIEAAKPAYNFADDVLLMPPSSRFESMEEYYLTLFHELVHSTGHGSRLDRDMKSRRDRESYSREELIAELGASFLCAHCGIDTPQREAESAAYLAGWAKALQAEPNLIISASAAAQRAVNFILGVKEVQQ